VLIYDKTGQNVIGPLLSVKDLRELGVTLHLSLHSERYLSNYHYLEEEGVFLFVFNVISSTDIVMQCFLLSRAEVKAPMKILCPGLREIFNVKLNFFLRILKRYSLIFPAYLTIMIHQLPCPFNHLAYEIFLTLSQNVKPLAKYCEKRNRYHG
jgi:hypothetical protein